MAMKFKDMNITKFNKLLEEGKVISASKARLIPLTKAGDENTLTSILLSSLTLVDEFRKFFFSSINMKQYKNIHVYTQMRFKKNEIEEHEELIPDGFICIVSNGKIIESALIEAKNGNDKLKIEQVNNYIEIAKKYGIDKVISISNEFVTCPTHSPLGKKLLLKKNGVSLYHLSWTQLLIYARILLAKNDTNIKDEDQKKIMMEVVSYFESEKSGILGFTRMSKCWQDLRVKLKHESLKNDDEILTGAIKDWLQEEKDMSLQLSKKLGVLVKNMKVTNRADISARIKQEAEFIRKNNCIESKFRIKAAKSDITIRANFLYRSLEFITEIRAPQDVSTIKGQIGKIGRMIGDMNKKNPDKFKQIWLLHNPNIFKDNKKELKEVILKL
jgi:hypothetical protein